ncbi:MAG: sigma-70 family RNA polymerase sigma factor [Planctomycetota bacterium]
MDEPRPEHVTKLLVDWCAGDQRALAELMPLVMDQLKAQARRYLERERSDHTLQATALVNEAYLRLIDQSKVKWQNRTHFFAVCAQIMRRILVDHARNRRAQKRGGSAKKVDFDDLSGLLSDKQVDIVALDDALHELAKIDKRQARIVELRFFGGLSIEEAAEVEGVSRATANREWAMARAWLHMQMEA